MKLSNQKKAFFFVIYLLLCTPRMINQSLQLARRSGTGSSCARQNNLSAYDEHLGRVAFQIFPAALSGSRSEKSRDGMRREDKGKRKRREKSQSQGRRALSGAGRWGPRLQKSPEPQTLPGRRPYPPSPTPKALGLFSPWTPKSIQFSNVNSPSCCTAKTIPLVNLPIWHWLELMVKNFENESWQHWTHQTIPSIKTSGPGFLDGNFKEGASVGTIDSSRVCFEDSGWRNRVISVSPPATCPATEYLLCMCQIQLIHSSSLSAQMILGAFPAPRNTQAPEMCEALPCDLTSQPRRTRLLVRGHRGGWGMGILPPTPPWPQWVEGHQGIQWS